MLSGASGIWFSVTVTVHVAVCPVDNKVALIVTVPGAIAVITPRELIVAMDELLVSNSGFSSDETGLIIVFAGYRVST